MIKIDRNINQNDREELVKELIQSQPKKFSVAIDLRDGKIVLGVDFKAKFYNVIGSIDLNLAVTNKRTYKEKASELYRIIKKYNAESLICQSRVKSLFGIRGIMERALIKYVCNPYYKCAPEMKLYDRNVINYILE